MDISHGHTFISLFFIVPLFHSITDFLAVFLIPSAQFLVSPWTITLLLSLLFSVLRRWIRLVPVVSFSSKSSFFLGWTAHDTTTLKKVGKRHTISDVIGVFMNHSTSRSPIIQYVVSFRPPASDWILGSVVASVVNLACWSSQLRRLSETLYRMSPSMLKRMR